MLPNLLKTKINNFVSKQGLQHDINRVCRVGKQQPLNVLQMNFMGKI